MPERHLRVVPDVLDEVAAKVNGDACASCAGVNRRGFLTHASLLSLGAWITAACGDGILGGPNNFPGLTAAPFRVDPGTLPQLAQIGGRAIVTQAESGAVLVERISASQYRGFSLSCPHQGTTVDVLSDGFLCPNHQARFSREGIWQGGQSTGDLNLVSVVLQADGSLLVGGVAPPPAAIALAATSTTFVVSTTGALPATQVVAISNSGGGILSGLALSLAYGANQPTGWLTIGLSSATGPANITLAVNRGALGAGTYSATVRISAANAVDTTTLGVSFVVQDPNAAPSLQLSTAAITFSAPVGSSPTAQGVQVNNAGGGALTGLNVAVTYGAGANGWLSTSALGSTNAPTTLTLRPITAALSAGSYTATVVIGGAGVVSRSITITLTIAAAGLAVTIANFPALANVGGVAGSVGLVNGGPVAVARISATSFAAFSMRCTHAGTTVNVVNGASFRCPNHGALFTSTGQLAQGSPINTAALTGLRVSYTVGATVLYVS